MCTHSDTQNNIDILHILTVYEYVLQVYFKANFKLLKSRTISCLDSEKKKSEDAFVLKYKPEINMM